jgi:serine phosphatase RsbU (regulator of sigma subunit)
LISDGVSEAQDAHEQLFGHDRLTQALSGLPSATGMVDGLRDAVRSFENGTEPSDDLTILALRYRGPDSRKTMPAV